MVNAVSGSATGSSASKNKVARRSSSGKNLFNREKSPSSFSTPARKPGISLAEREENPNSAISTSNQLSQKPSFSYTSSKKQNSPTGPIKKKSSIKSLKKAAPLLIILAPIPIILVLFAGLGSLLPPHINANTQDAFEIQNTASDLANGKIMVSFLETGSIPSGFMNRLFDSGIEIGYLDNSGTFIAGLRPDSNSTVALASSSDSNQKSDNSLVIRFNNVILNANNFAESITIDPELYSAFSEATYGRALNHFDSIADSFYSNIKNSRNIFKDYVVSSNNEEDMKNFRDTFANVFQDSNDSNIAFLRQVSEQEEGTKIGNFRVQYNKQSVSNQQEQLKEVFTEIGSSHGDDGRSIGNISSLANSVINSNETYQSMQYYLTIEEAISKMMAGESGSTPINSVLNFLTTSTTSIIQNPDGTTSEVNGTPLQSPGLSAVLSKSFSSGLATETSKYSLDRLINYGGEKIASLYGNYLASNSDIKTNNQITNSINETSVQVSTNSPTLIADLTYVITQHIGDDTSEIVDAFVASIVPSISRSILFENAGEKLSGIAAGEFFSKGGAALGNHIAAFAEGGSIGTPESIANFSAYIDKHLAMEAKSDRLNHSPFDITNQNTFLGSIAWSLMNNFSKSNSFASLLSSFSSLTNQSMISVLPSTFAAGSESSFRTTYGNCPALENIGAKGDIYCNPIITFDAETIKTALNSTAFEDFLEKNLISSDNLNTINLASSKTYNIGNEDYIEKFVSYNNGRQSNFGLQDANIYAALYEDASFPQKILEKLAKVKQKLNDLFNTESSLESLTGHIEEFSNIATGKDFINSKNNDKWNNYKYAQAYVVYSRALEQMEYFSEDNTNEASLSKYFIPGSGTTPIDTYLANLVENHKDETDAEYVARIAGITEENAKLALGYISYASYLASIDYDSKYLNSPIKEPIQKLAFSFKQDKGAIFLTNRQYQLSKKKEQYVA